MLPALLLTLLADYGAPEGKLSAGALGVVELVKSTETRATVRLRIPRAWRTKAGTKIDVGGTVTLADDRGVLFTGPAPAFIVEGNCENDGGPWSEPVATLELDLAKLARPLRKPISSARIIGLVTLGSVARPPLKGPAAKSSRFRVDFDGDGQPDAELREVKADAGCGDRMEENDFSVVTANEKISAMCCGP